MSAMAEPAPLPTGPALLAAWLRVDSARRRRDLPSVVLCTSTSLNNWLRGETCPVKRSRALLAALTGIPELADRDAWGGAGVDEDEPTAEQLAAARVAGEKLAAEARS